MIFRRRAARRISERELADAALRTSVSRLRADRELRVSSERLATSREIADLLARHDTVDLLRRALDRLECRQDRPRGTV